MTTMTSLAPPVEQPPNKFAFVYERYGNCNITRDPDHTITFESTDLSDVIPLAKQMFKVGAHSNVKSVAGSIAHTCRRGTTPVVLAAGDKALNQAIKGIAIARSYLEEDSKYDIEMQPEFRSQGGMYLFLAKYLRGTKKERCVGSELLSDSKRRKQDIDNSSDDEDHRHIQNKKDPKLQGRMGNIDVSQHLRVARHSDPYVVAGAIAKKVRRGEEVNMLCIGGLSVSASVQALCHSRKYLQEDCVSISFQPSFIHLTLDGQSRSGIRFIVYPRKIATSEQRASSPEA